MLGVLQGHLCLDPETAELIYSFQFHALMVIVLSSFFCFSFGITEKKSSPVASSASTVTAKVCNGWLLPVFGRMNAIIFCGGVKSYITLIIVCRHGHLIVTDGDRFLFRQDLSRNHINFALRNGEQSHLFL